MPTPLDQRHKLLTPGDVIQVNRSMTDKKTGKPYVWRFFAIVVDDDGDEIECVPFGAVSQSFKDQTMTIDPDDRRNTVHHLEPEEWPDGVHANRMRMILIGLVKII